MKPTSTLLLLTVTVMLAVTSNFSASAQQQYKLRQVTNMMGMKSETTIYVKGMRKRTEGGGLTGMGANLTTIEQCDKQRTVTLNDKKKLNFCNFLTIYNDFLDYLNNSFISLVCVYDHIFHLGRNDEYLPMNTI